MKEKDGLDEALIKYKKKFKEGFPLFSLPQMNEPESILFIEKCIKEGKNAEQYYPANDDESIYQ